MTGSGLGVAAIIGLMYRYAPEQLLLVISATAFIAAMILAFAISLRWIAATLVFAAVCLTVFGQGGTLPLKIELSEHKSLVYFKALPSAKTLAVRYSPLARLDCIEAPAIRYFPGLSITYQGSLPEQKLIISDADGISAINHFEHLSDLKCYDYVTSALGYHLLKEPDVCIIGAGGGSDVAQALASNARKITAVEMNGQIIDLVSNTFNEFASGLYSRPNVDTIIAEGRSFLQTTDHLFDIINISLLDSFSASAAGLYALNESHLYTIEAIEQALARLSPKGFLSITRMLKTPPRDSLKMLATVAEALRRRGIADPSGYIIMIRSWATATILVSPKPFSDLQIMNTKQFAQERSFDLVHLPGIKPEEVNRFHILEEPIYYTSAQNILSSQYETFYRDYTYNIRPATDDKPYFFDFFKWKSLPHMIRTMPGQWLPFSEWGYLVLVATLLQAILASAVFILLPLSIAKPIKAIRSGKIFVLTYFFLLGLAYMLLEMGFIQKMTLLIGHPVFGVAVTLLGFLVFSGCGSLVAGLGFYKSTTGMIWIAVLAIIIIGIAEIILMRASFDWLIGFSRTNRILLGLAITGPLAFFMGMPFPTALKRLGANRQPLVPWAWGINGFASVIGAVLGTFLAISVGFIALSLAALTCYFLAAAVSKQTCI